MEDATPPPPRAWGPLRFQAWQSAPDVSFWQKLAALKLHAFQLDDRPRPLRGFFAPSRAATVPARLAVDQSSFVADARDSPEGVNAHLPPGDRARYEWTAPGVIYNTNTLEDFKAQDKAAILHEAGQRVIRVLTDPDVASLEALNSFVVVAFAELKKHTFLYWFGFPAVVTPGTIQSLPPVPASSVFDVVEQGSILRQLAGMRPMQPTTQADHRDQLDPVGTFPSFFVIERRQNAEVRVVDFPTWRRQDLDAGTHETIFGFVDPCPLSTNPGWPLRNFLALLMTIPPKHLPRDRSVKILSFREHVRHATDGDDGLDSSLVFEIQTGEEFTVDPENIRILGWEPNLRGKMGPRLVDLGGLLDPMRLAEQSVDLNLKLMLWRQLPSLQLDKLAQTKCLVLGAGTLGCFTARSLLSWGFRHITMVDNSVVSHSNPVRQPLFEFQDVGKPKAECAANSLKRIYPLVTSHGVHLSIPMAGHPLSNSALMDEAKNALDQLSDLVETHDVVLLGTDSRESRWLPTVMCVVKGKLLLNAALGFDSYLVMRHGLGMGATCGNAPLGCYFCNDVVGPRDSLKDRTLDQMCTVTRPGLAPIAAATAVELLVAVLHHHDGVLASAEKPDDTTTPLSFLPHQLRGFLNSFSTMVITGQAFDKCIACSQPVVQAYKEDAFGLLEHACNSSTYLEELTGLHTLTAAADSFMDELDAFDGEDDEDAFL